MLKTRIITAILLIAAFLPALFFASHLVWAAIMLIVSMMAIYEWAKLVDLTKATAIFCASLLATFGLVILFMLNENGFHWLFYQSLIVFIVSAVFWLLIAPILLRKYMVVESKLLLVTIGMLLIVPLWLALIVAKGLEPWLLLTLLATIWIADSAAYFAGKCFGKHKLAPSISPGKTWEGVLGALIAVTLFGGALYFSGVINQIAILLLLWAVAILGVIGDLFESLIKRQFGKKDSGQLLPGHGGILDRIDGLLPSLPIAVLAIYFFNYFQAAS